VRCRPLDAGVLKTLLSARGNGFSQQHPKAPRMFFWIYDHPTWQMALLFAVAFGVVAVIGLLAFRATLHGWLHRGGRANEMVGHALSSFAILYGLLLGLLAVAAYTGYSATGDQVTKEAASLATLYRDLSGLPEPARTQLQDTLRRYTRDVIDVSWPAQQKGVVPTTASAIMTEFNITLNAFKPADLGEAALHGEAITQANDLVELRSQRLANVNAGIPDILWWVVLLGALINTLLLWMVDTDAHVHILLTALLSGFTGLVIFLVAAMDFPFRGEVSIGPEPFEQVYATVMTPPGN
jgi:Protein of unknown function (DUF4239)